jgi:hypothetical protein
MTADQRFRAEGLISPLRIGGRVAWLVDAHVADLDRDERRRARPVVAPHRERLSQIQRTLDRRTT